MEEEDDIDWSAIMGAAVDDDDDPLGVGMDLGKELKGLDLGKLKGGKAAGKKAAAGGSKAAAAAGGKKGGLKDMKVPELKAECKRLGLPVSGSKGELLDRLAGAGLS